LFHFSWQPRSLDKNECKNKMTQASLRASRIIAAMRPKTPALPAHAPHGQARGFGTTSDSSGFFTFGIVLGMLLAGALLIWRTVRSPDAS